MKRRGRDIYFIKKQEQRNKKKLVCRLFIISSHDF